MGSSSFKPQFPQRTVARSCPFNIWTLIASLPHLGHKYTLGSCLLGIRITLLRLLPILIPLSLTTQLAHSAPNMLKYVDVVLNIYPTVA